LTFIKNPYKIIQDIKNNPRGLTIIINNMLKTKKSVQKRIKTTTKGKKLLHRQSNKIILNPNYLDVKIKIKESRK
jgi:hypothetical protein